MTTRLRDGQRDWRMTRDRDGQREYKITFRVTSDDPLDGPAAVLETDGLPIPGDYWIVDNDADLWATCKEDATVTPVVIGEPNTQWDVEVTFSTKGDEKRCKDQQWDDPLLIPDRISGSFVKYTEQASFDEFGDPIVNSAFEKFEGPQVEFDASRATVKISQNRADLELALFTPMVETVNDAPLWGLPERTIKLANVTWEAKYYGQCYLYYERTFEFEIRYNPGSASDFLGFDRILQDEGSKVLKGHWQAKGSGGTINITMVSASGAMEAVTLNAVGSGYEADDSVYLYVTGGAGQDGIVIADTDSNGKLVSGSVEVVQGGKGYTVSSGVGTSVDTQWVLDEIAPGIEPDFRNPNHFIRYTDVNGNPARLILDGFGKPAPMPRSGQVGDVSGGTDANTPFTVVTVQDHLLVDGDAVRISGVSGLTAANGLWRVTVVDHLSFTLDGSEGLANGAFDVTVIPTWSVGPGFVLVQKYAESNFLLLGIPTVF